MSVCISKHGEYSDHQLGEGADRFVCQLCHVFDEDAASARIAALEESAVLLPDDWQTRLDLCCIGVPSVAAEVRQLVESWRISAVSS